MLDPTLGLTRDLPGGVCMTLRLKWTSLPDARTSWSVARTKAIAMAREDTAIAIELAVVWWVTGTCVAHAHKTENLAVQCSGNMC